LAPFSNSDWSEETRQVNPFADVRRAVPERNAAGLAPRQQSDGITIDEEQVTHIDRGHSCFRLDERTNHLHIVRCELAAYLHDRNAVVGHQSVDSAGHAHLFGQHTRRGKRPAISGSLKMDRYLPAPGVRCCESRECGESGESGEGVSGT
jgi:hypothetical protein